MRTINQQHTSTAALRWLVVIILAVLHFSSLAAQSQPARRVRSGIIIADTGSVVRAMEPFNGTTADGEYYAEVVNLYQCEFLQARVYCMVVPNAVAFYCPDTATTWTRQEQPVVEHLYRQLLPGVKSVNLFPVLSAHKDEPIYSRTDHHWSPLGAYYAAQEFARVAGVPFKSLDHYERHVIHNYVGSMFTFSRDMTVKRAPEEFVYYTPRDVSYKAMRIRYTLTRDRQGVVSSSAPEEFSFFRDYPDGSSSAYCVFMGGDTNTTSVTTSTKNRRRLLVLKDSYGNALPGYLFGSFQEIHVVDCRYFTQNIRDFIAEHQITDILFANNLIHATMEKTCQSYEKYLEQ